MDGPPPANGGPDCLQMGIDHGADFLALSEGGPFPLGGLAIKLRFPHVAGASPPSGRWFGRREWTFLL